MSIPSNKPKQNKFTTQTLAQIGVMAALVFVSNYFSIPLPGTRIHLGAVCVLLSGFYLGGLPGGLAAGLGAGMYDLLAPNIGVLSAPTTFFFRFIMAFLAGTLSRLRIKAPKPILHTIAAAVAAVTYAILYLGKKGFEQILLGSSFEVVLLAITSRAPASATNAVIGICASVPLSLIALPRRRNR